MANTKHLSNGRVKQKTKTVR